MFFVNYLTFFTTTFKLHPKNIGVLENKQFSKANYPCLDPKKILYPLTIMDYRIFLNCNEAL